jgi:hypothetical protein
MSPSLHLHKLQCIVGLAFQVLPCWKVDLSPSVCWKAEWTRFSTKTLPVLRSNRFICILKKNSLVLADYKNTDNMIQPPSCLKICGSQWCFVLDSLRTYCFGCMFWNICILYRLPFSPHCAVDPSFSFLLSQPCNIVNWFKITFGEIPEWFPSCPATELGRSPVTL